MIGIRRVRNDYYPKVPEICFKPKVLVETVNDGLESVHSIGESEGDVSEGVVSEFSKEYSSYPYNLLYTFHEL